MGGITEHGGNLANGHNVKPAYFAQHQAEVLDPVKNMFEEVLYDAGGMTEREVRTILGSFLFTGEDVLKKTAVLSGGEKMRVALAKLITSDANFLLLDEPTNHLDMLSVEVLIDALNDYEGTYIVVSHDRFFLSEVATKIWYLDNGILMEYPGSYEEFDEWKNQQLKLIAKTDKTSDKTEKKPSTVAAPQEKIADKPKEKEQVKLQKQLEEAEKKQQLLRDEIFKLEEEAVKPEVYTNKTAIAELKNKLERVRQSLAEADKEWERIFELLVE
jgi:ATP-binding cassette subfamily F protein 3